MIYSSEKVITGKIGYIYTKLVPVIVYTESLEIKSFILLKEITKHKISDKLTERCIYNRRLLSVKIDEKYLKERFTYSKLVYTGNKYKNEGWTLM